MDDQAKNPIKQKPQKQIEVRRRNCIQQRDVWYAKKTDPISEYNLQIGKAWSLC